MKTAIKQFLEFLRCMERLRPHLRGGRYLIGALVFASFLITGFEILGVGLLVPLLSLLLGGEKATPMRPLQWLEKNFPGHDPTTYVLILCIVIVCAIVAKNLTAFGVVWMTATLRKRVKINLRESLFKSIQTLDLHQFDSRPAGDFANLFLVETDRTANALDMTITVGQRVAMATVYMAALFYISNVLTSAAIALGIMLGIAFTVVYRRLIRLGQALTEQNRKLSSFLVEAFAATRVVRAANAQEQQLQKFQRVNQAQANAEKTGIQSQGIIPSVAETLGVIGAMTIVGLAYPLLVRPQLMLASHLLGFGFILLRVIPLLNQIYGLQGHLFYLTGGAHELERWLNQPSFPQKPFGDVEFKELKQGIQFRDVHHEYPVGRLALKGLSFDIPAGKTIALVGASGA